MFGLDQDAHRALPLSNNSPALVLCVWGRVGANRNKKMEGEQRPRGRGRVEMAGCLHWLCISQPKSQF